MTGCFQRPVDSSKVPEKEICDRTRPVSSDRTLRVLRPVDSSKVPEKEICDRTCPASSDRTLRVLRLVESSKVPVRVLCDRTRPISADRTLPASGQLFFTGSQVQLTGVSGHPAEAHNGSFFRLPYK